MGKEDARDARKEPEKTGRTESVAQKGKTESGAQGSKPLDDKPGGRILPTLNLLPQSSVPHGHVSSPLLNSVLQRLAQGEQREAGHSTFSSNVFHNSSVNSSAASSGVNASSATLGGNILHTRPDIYSLQDSRARGQSVSFCDSELDKSRRFTILAQPLSVSLATVGRTSLVIGITPRKASNNEILLSSSRNGSVTGFTDRVESPTEKPAHNLMGYDSRYSPSPPLVKSPKFGIQPSFDTSRRGSDIPLATVSRNSSVKKSQKALVDSSLNTSAVPFQQYLLKEDDKKFHILLACTGSVATIKVPLIIDKLFQIFGSSKISVQLVVTKSACHFLKGLKIRKDVKIWRDEDEWTNFSEFCSTTTTVSTVEQKKPKNSSENLILHNELRKWADIVLIAPLSANTLAKLAHGISDNLITSILRCWGSVSGVNTTKKPVLVAPAMNTLMYTHPLTSKHLKILLLNEEGFGFEILKPMEKVLVCGDIGMGGMREWLAIVETLRIRIKDLIVQKSHEDGLAINEGDDKDTKTNNDVNEITEEEDEEDDDDDDDEDEEDDDDEDDDDEDEDEVKPEEGKPAEKEFKRDFRTKLVNEDLDGVQRTITPLSAEAQSII